MQTAVPTITKEEIIAAVKECAAKLGRAPSMGEFRRATAIGKGQIRKHFGTFRQLLEASGLEARGSGHVVEMKDLFADWAGIAQRLKKSPTLADYEMQSKYSPRPLVRRFGYWVNVPTGMLEYAKKEGLEGEWEDVLEMVAAEVKAEGNPSQTSEPRRAARRAQVMHDRPIYG